MRTLRTTWLALLIALTLLVSPLVGLDPHVFMPALAVVGVVAAVVLGRVFLNAAARNVDALE